MNSFLHDFPSDGFGVLMHSEANRRLLMLTLYVHRLGRLNSSYLGEFGESLTN